MRSERGFTLLELVVVIAVVALLLTASVLWLRPRDFTAQNEAAQRQLHIATIAQALVKYRAANQHFPEGIPKNFTEIGSTDEGGYDLCGALVPTFMKEMQLESKAGLAINGKDELQTAANACDRQKGITYLSGYYIRQNADGRIELASSHETDTLTLQ